MLPKAGLAEMEQEAKAKHTKHKPQKQRSVGGSSSFKVSGHVVGKSLAAA